MLKINILTEFEKRYNGDPSETERICEAIAIENGLDIDEVTDFVYIYRYENDEHEPEIEDERD